MQRNLTRVEQILIKPELLNQIIPVAKICSIINGLQNSRNSQQKLQDIKVLPTFGTRATTIDKSNM